MSWIDYCRTAAMQRPWDIVSVVQTPVTGSVLVPMTSTGIGISSSSNATLNFVQATASVSDSSVPLFASLNDSPTL